MQLNKSSSLCLREKNEFKKCNYLREKKTEQKILHYVNNNKKEYYVR